MNQQNKTPKLKTKPKSIERVEMKYCLLYKNMPIGIFI